MRNENRSVRSPVRSEGVARRKFFQLAAAGTLLLAGINFGSIASAQGTKIKGVTFHSVTLVNTVEKLDKETGDKYRRGEGVNKDKSKGFTVNIPYVMSAAATLRPDEKNGRNTFGVAYPKEKDKDPKRKNAGMWTTNINDFARVVKEVTGDDLKRVRIIIERTTDPDYNDEVISAYAIPVDNCGDFVGKYNGGYLAVGASYYPDRGEVYGGKLMLVEPPSGRIARR